MKAKAREAQQGTAEGQVNACNYGAPSASAAASRVLCSLRQCFMDLVADVNSI